MYIFSFLGGFDPVSGPPTQEYQAVVGDGRLKYRYGINKKAGDQIVQKPVFSTTLGQWQSRGFSQQIVSEDQDRFVVEVSVPTDGLTSGFLRLDAIGSIPVFIEPIIGNSGTGGTINIIPGNGGSSIPGQIDTGIVNPGQTTPPVFF